MKKLLTLILLLAGLAYSPAFAQTQKEGKSLESLNSLMSGYAASRNSSMFLKTMDEALQLLTDMTPSERKENKKVQSMLGDMANDYLSFNKYEQSLRCSNLLLGINPNDAYHPTNVVRCLYELGKYKEAALAFPKALNQATEYGTYAVPYELEEYGKKLNNRGFRVSLRPSRK